MQQIIKEEILESMRLKDSVAKDEMIISQVENLVLKCLDCLKNGGKIIFCGNGGSFADAQHLTAEFVSRLRFDRKPLASITLGMNNSCISAIGNDYGYDQVFSRELQALGSSKDIFIPITTSGNSPNVIEAIKVAKEYGMYTIALTGSSGGKIKDMCECIIVPSSRTEKIQEVHIMLGHITCFLVEQKYFKP